MRSPCVRVNGQQRTLSTLFFFSSEKRRRMDRNEEWQSRPSYSLPYTQRTRNRQTWWVILVHTHTLSRAYVRGRRCVCVCIYIRLSAKARLCLFGLWFLLCSSFVLYSHRLCLAFKKKNIFPPVFVFFLFSLGQFELGRHVEPVNTKQKFWKFKWDLCEIRTKAFEYWAVSFQKRGSFGLESIAYHFNGEKVKGLKRKIYM